MQQQPCSPAPPLGALPLNTLYISFLLVLQVDAKPASSKEEMAGRPVGPHSGRGKKIFIGGVGPNVDDKMLRAYFSQFGAVEDAFLATDHITTRSRGFAFITFREPVSVDRVRKLQLLCVLLLHRCRLISALGRQRCRSADS
jgi:hypothetical protein